MAGEALYDALEEAIHKDDEPWDKKGFRLLQLHENASVEEKELMDKILIAICGWSFDTLMEIAERNMTEDA